MSIRPLIQTTSTAGHCKEVNQYTTQDAGSRRITKDFESLTKALRPKFADHKIPAVMISIQETMTYINNHNSNNDEP